MIDAIAQYRSSTRAARCRCVFSFLFSPLAAQPQEKASELGDPQYRPAKKVSSKSPPDHTNIHARQARPRRRTLDHSPPPASIGFLRFSL